MEAAQTVIHLDTSFLIRAMQPGSDEDRRWRQWVHAGEQLGVSAVAWAELLCGPVSDERSAALAVLLEEPESFNAAAAPVAARLFNQTGRRRSSLPDCMIAATAIQADATLATSDITDFRRFEPLGLKLLKPAA